MPPPNLPGPVTGAAPAACWTLADKHARAVSPIVLSYSLSCTPVNVGSLTVMLPHLAMSGPPGTLAKASFGGPAGLARGAQGETLESIFLIKAPTLGHNFSAIRDQVFPPLFTGPQRCAGLHQKLVDERMRVTFALF